MSRNGSGSESNAFRLRDTTDPANGWLDADPARYEAPRDLSGRTIQVRFNRADPKWMITPAIARTLHTHSNTLQILCTEMGAPRHNLR